MWTQFYPMKNQWKECVLLISMGREAWRAAIHEVAKSRTQLSDWSDLIWVWNMGTWLLLINFCIDSYICSFINQSILSDLTHEVGIHIRYRFRSYH